MSICFNPPRRQRGDMMLEALIAVLITSLIGGGLAHVASRVMNSQRDAKVENLVVERLRDSLQSQGIGLCAAGSLDIAMPGGSNTKATVACEVASANVTLNGVTRAVDAPQRVDLTVAASELGAKGTGKGDTDLLLSTRQ
jgi:Tfp pilus assembly protein PilV